MIEGKGPHRGGCLCGAVRYEVKGPLRQALVCHCRMCQQTHGVPAAYSAAAHTDFRLVETRGLKWYRSSKLARRGFCGDCGASLFWERLGAPTISIACGSLEPPSGVRIVGHIFMANKGDYYEITDGLPQREEGSGGQIPATTSSF
ncbi:MAG TPA: GFA family protein [Kiloniellales bacterium]|nr:GFA family protein [Kiloniellales bacterium]